MPTVRTTLSLFFLFTLCCLLIACSDSGGPKAAQPGSPAFFWAGAKQAYQAGDYSRTAENLSKLTQSENEYRSRAQAWLIMLATGIVQGNMEVADAYDAGARANRENALAFRRQASAVRSQAKSSVLQSVEALHEFNAKIKDPSLTFEFGYPTGSLTELPTLQRVAKGMLLQPAEAESTVQKSVQKGVVWSACKAVGADDDSARAAEVFKQTPVQVPREKFLLGMAGAMVEQADLFGPKQLDEPVRMKMLLAEAQESLKQVPASKETKELEAKIQKAMKLMKTT
jgi:hypothetical protein